MKVVIVGGVATGPKVAARLRRLKPDADITIVEQGNVISYGACGIPLYLGSLVPELEELTLTASGQKRDVAFFQGQKDVRVLTNTRAISIDRAAKTVSVRHLLSGEEDTLPYDYLVLATGSRPYVPPLPGAGLSKVFTLHDPDDAEQLKRTVKEEKIRHVTVIGAGLIGIEIADVLAGPRLKVTVCESQNHVLPRLLDPDMAKLLERQMQHRGVDVRLGCKVKALEGDDTGAVGQVLTDQGQIETELVVFAVGVRPAIELAQAAGLTIGETGAIRVNESLQTEDPCIYAGGDCAEQTHVMTGKPVYIPLASTANKQGRIIANNIAGKNEVFPGVAGTSVLQAFDFNIGRTGLSEAEACDLGYKVITGVASGLDAAHFYPMHSSIVLKLIADETSGRLLGAQVCGLGDGIKRLDVLVTALKFGTTLVDIGNLDLGYAPPFATPLDVVVHGANALENKRLGLVRGLSAFELQESLRTGEEVLLLDVRKEDEVESNPLAGPQVLRIPLGQLRKRWQEVPAFRRIVTVCEMGIRAYEAACILRGKGLTQVAYLEGGIAVWSAYQEEEQRS